MTRREILISPFAAPLLAQEGNRFSKLAEEYIEWILKSRPEAATAIGEHRYDDRLSDLSDEARGHDLAKHRDFIRRVRALNAARLDPVSRVDARILEGQLESAIWRQAVLREHEWNPMGYNVGYTINYMVERDWAPLPERLKNIQKRLEAVPAYLIQARKNLKTATRIHAETAASQTSGTIKLFTMGLDSYLAKAPELKAAFAPAQAKAVAALKEWQEWIRKELLPRADKDFRIGPEFYDQKLKHTLGSDLTAAQIRDRGLRDLKQTQAALFDASRSIVTVRDGDDPAKTIKAALDKLAESRPDGATIVSLAERELADATDFVRRKSLVSPFDCPLKIVEMPEFQRGVTVANLVPPGPLEKNGMTFFNISPPSSSWNQAQVESYFREYNNSMTKNLVVHEAMPGHYLQIAHANRFQAPTLTRSIFRSRTFVEGWAVYAERVMAEAGYGGPEVRMQQLKMRLRTIINALIDQGIHAQGMSEQQAMDLMMKEGFQERSEAAGKWRRAQLTSTQLSTYYAGTIELDQLREDYEKKKGAIRDLKAFHDQMLSFGSPAPRYVRELMGV